MYAGACNKFHWDIYLCTSCKSLERNRSLADNGLVTGDILLAYDRGRRGVPADLLSYSMDYCLVCIRTTSVLNNLHLGRHYRCRQTKRVGGLLMEWARECVVHREGFTYTVNNRAIDIEGTLEHQNIIDGDVIVASPNEA